MISRRRWLILALILLASIGLPFLFAALVSGKDFVFNGFLMNPGDSNTYLAKMYAGWNGAWRFTLPYTAEPGQGGYLYLFYLFLGHLARWLGAPLMAVYQAARLISALVMLASLARFMQFFVGKQGSGAWNALIWAIFGGGLGWLVVLFGFLPADTWVIDAFPFLSAFTIPHFSLSLALMFWIFSRVNQPLSVRNALLDFAAALLMSNLSSFSVVVTLIVLGGDALWSWRLHGSAFWRGKRWLRLAWITLGGCPMLLYQFWLLNTDPVMKVWNAQDLTPSPAPWDLLISFSPALLLAVVGGWVIIRRSRRKTGANPQPANPSPYPLPEGEGLRPTDEQADPARLLVVWAVLGLLLLYVPLNLQRRFILGLYVPLVGLAAIGLGELKKRKALIYNIAFGLSLPTNLILVAMLGLNCLAHNPILYMTGDEAAAMSWIRANTGAHDLVLAAPDTGTLIPANTGRRVIYGHLYETAYAEQEKQTVEDYFSGQMDAAQADALLTQRKVDFVFCGPREQEESGTSGCPVAAGLQVVFQQGKVTLYAAHP